MSDSQLGGVVNDSLNESDLERPENQSVIEANELSRYKKALNIAKRAVQSSVVIFELSPGNEVVRYGALAATLTHTQNPIVGAAVLGGSTLIVEGSAALATSSLLTSKNTTKSIDWLNSKINKIVPENAKMSPIAEAGVAMYGGSVVVLAEKQRENPNRTIEDNRKHGMFTAGWLAGVLAVEGALIAEGVDNYTDPKTVGGVLLALAGIGAGFSWAKKKIKQDKPDLLNDNLLVEGAQKNDGFTGKFTNQYEKKPPRYDLTKEELSSLENDLVSEFDSTFEQKGIYAAWIRPSHRYANIVRNYEAQYFPEVATDLSVEDEEHTLFLALVDTREGEHRVVHGGTISGIKFTDSEHIDKPDLEKDKTGFIVIDDLISMGNFKATDFYEYYEAKGIDLQRCISVETNFRIGKKTKSPLGTRTPQIAYNLFFKAVEDRGNVSNSLVFTSINRASVLSFMALGIDYEPLMGRKDLITSEMMLQGKEFIPVALPYSDKNKKTFSQMSESVQELYF